MQMRSVAIKLKGDEPRFLQWAKSIGLARKEEYRDFMARCIAVSASSKLMTQQGGCACAVAVGCIFITITY